MPDRSIVVGLDGSAGARYALDWALRHAVALDATVLAVTAYNLEGTDWFDPDGPAEQREKTDERQCDDVTEALAGIDEPPRIRRVVVNADPVAALSRAAAGADLLVLGSHGRGGLRDAMLGSVGERCIRRCSTPVVIVPTPDGSEPTGARASSGPPLHGQG